MSDPKALCKKGEQSFQDLSEFCSIRTEFEGKFMRLVNLIQETEGTNSPLFKIISTVDSNHKD